MKKKDLNEENFDEIDDTVEEIEDVEEIDEIDEVEDLDEMPVEDDKASKKGKKDKKKKKKMSTKGKIITATSVVAVVAAIVLVVIFVVLPMIQGNPTNADYSGTYGNSKPTATAHTSVNDSMNAKQMLLAAMDNYYNASYVGNICVNGGVVTKVGGLNINQAVKSGKLRSGAVGTNGTKYFMYNCSFGIANTYEEALYTEGGSVSTRKGNSMSPSSDKSRLVVKSWTTPEESPYATMDAYYAKTSNDFTKLWAYDVQESTIAKSSAVEKKSDGCYYFSVDLDYTTAVADYIGVMTVQLEKNMGMTVKSLTFTKLHLEFCVWENGFIRYFKVTESYVMKMADVPVIGKLDIGITNNCMNEFSFDKTEKLPYDTLKKEKEIKKLDINSAFQLF